MASSTRILLVDDSRTFARMTAHAVEARLAVPVTTAFSLAEAHAALDTMQGQRVVVVTGLSLPDGSDVRIVESFAERHLPVVVMTGMFDDAVRRRILDMPIIDYVLKDSPTSLEYLVELLRRLDRNRTYGALVVDDSKALRQMIAALLALHQYRVVEAENGQEGLRLALADPSIRLVVTDYDMPGLNGVEMVRRIRQSRPRDELAIIALSGTESFSNKGLLSAQFLKNGANDFLVKPFEREEFHCRIEQNVSALETMGRLRDMATKDFLTGLFNRRHFFAVAQPMFRKGTALTAAMMDIDHFKSINDTHGHDAGDLVLKEVAAALAASIRPGDLLARFGGEEFCVLAQDLDPHAALAYFDGLRQVVQGLAISFEGKAIPVTTSIGVAFTPADHLDALLNRADQGLYKAKTGGRNRVEMG